MMPSDGQLIGFTLLVEHEPMKTKNRTLFLPIPWRRPYDDDPCDSRRTAAAID
jgi:hypothetical protein